MIYVQGYERALVGVLKRRDEDDSHVNYHVSICTTKDTKRRLDTPYQLREYFLHTALLNQSSFSISLNFARHWTSSHVHLLNPSLVQHLELVLELVLSCIVCRLTSNSN